MLSTSGRAGGGPQYSKLPQGDSDGGAGTSEIIEASEVDMVVDIDRSVVPGPASSFVDGHILPRGEPDMLRSGSWHVQRVWFFNSSF
jgi:hypothetical protein